VSIADREKRCFAYDKAHLTHRSVAVSDLDARYAGAGGARRPATSNRMSANIWRGTATSAIWNVTSGRG
jgi:hypothetical protein